jgi:hypothetical protein
MADIEHTPVVGSSEEATMEHQLLLHEIGETTCKTNKMVKKLYDAVKCLKKNQKRTLSLLNEEDYNMFNGVMEAVPTVPVAAGGCCNNNNGWGANGILEGLLIGSLFRGGFGGFGGYGGFGGGFGGFGGGMGVNMLDTSLTGAIDTNAILGAVNGVGRDILKTAGTHEIAAANHAASINANIAQTGAGVHAQMGRLAQEVGQIGFQNAINTLQVGNDIGRQVSAEGRHQDSNVVALGREIAGVDRHVGQSACTTQREVLEGNWALSRQMDQIAREQAACCCDNKLMMTMGFANVENSIKDSFCDLKSTMQRDKIEELRIAQASTADALRDKTLADGLATIMTNGFTQLGATFTSNILPAIGATVANAVQSATA